MTKSFLVVAGCLLIAPAAWALSVHTHAAMPSIQHTRLATSRPLLSWDRAAPLPQRRTPGGTLIAAAGCDQGAERIQRNM